MDFTQQSCEDFVSALASKEPVPGGGGAAALVGAMGTALGNMVGSLTLGKKKYADVQSDILDLKAKADALQNHLLALIERDAEAFLPLSKAYGLPADTEAQKAAKSNAMENALKGACEVPLEIMRKCREALPLLEAFAEKGTVIAVSDAGCGAAFCKAALMAAALNVFTNTKAMKDQTYAAQKKREAAEMLKQAITEADQLYLSIVARLY